MTAAFVAIAITLFGLAGTGLWFGVNRRRQDEVRIGVQALAKLKWRMCIGLILEALDREGFAEQAKLASASEESELLLVRDGKKFLFSYKHGTAYQISLHDVREFAGRLPLKGADRGLLITLGNADPAAVAAAPRLAIDIFDGANLWAKLRPFLPEATRSEVAAQAMAQSRKGLWAGGLASLASGLLVFVVGIALFSSDGGAPAPAVAAFRSSVMAPGTSDDTTDRQLDEARKALAEIASLTDADKARHRADVAKQVSLLPQVRSAIWSAQSTLLLTLSQSDGKDQQLIEEACRMLVGYEELRYSRLQLEPPAGTPLPVRWRQCN